MPVGCIVGSSPLLLAFPYVGTDIPPRLLARLTPEGRAQRDTDWHFMRVFEGIASDSTQVFAPFSRLLADVDALPGDARTPLNDRPGMIACFDSRGARIWTGPPQATERRQWHTAFFAPYHAALAAQLARLRAAHGHAVLVECVVERPLPDGRATYAPDVAILARMGLSCSAVLAADFLSAMKRQATHTVDFAPLREPGWTLRRHGRPRAGIQAMQLRISAERFLASTEEPWPFDPAKAEALRAVLGVGLRFLARWSPAQRLRFVGF